MFEARIIGCGLAAIALGVASPARSLEINLINRGGVEPGTQAYAGFSAASRYWESVLTNDVTINLDVGFSSLGAANADSLGQSSSNRRLVSIKGWESQLRIGGSSALDQIVGQNLPKLSSRGAIDVITPGYTFDGFGNIDGIDASTRLFDTDDSFNNRVIYVTSANAKALGYNLGNTVDGSVTFNSDYAFDFKPTDGIVPNAVNFLVVAIHEIGHVLGFESGVDDYDYFGEPSGIESYGGDPNADYWGSALDMFRYSTNPEGFGGGAPELDWSIRDPVTDPDAFTDSYFSVDGGETALFDNLMSRGEINTDSFQASHWRSASIGGQPFLGIMDPVAFDGGYVTALDLAAFDAIGWNTTVDVLGNPGYRKTTSEIYRILAPTPEPSTWVLMAAGSAMAGWAARIARRRREEDSASGLSRAHGT